MGEKLESPCSEIEVAEALYLASSLGSGYQLAKVIRRLAFERDGFEKIREQRDELLAACQALLSAVKSSDYAGISCDDVTGGNWFDRRDACIEAIKKVKGE